MAKSSNPATRTAFDFSSQEIDRYLKSGEQADKLRDYFGAEQYAELVDLAKKPPARSVRGQQRRVLVLPGIMGSTLGRRGLFGTIWINPLKIAAGALYDLALGEDGDHSYDALDVVPYFYYAFRKRLQSAGFNVDNHYYDWRLDLEESAKVLIERIKEEPFPKVSLVGHSMGGLIARLALRDDEVRAKVDRLVMLGTPNHGSFNSLQLFDGSHDLANKVERIDLQHDMDELMENVFNTFPSVYQLLPFQSKYAHSEFYQTGKWNWRGTHPKPVQKWLDRANELAALYPDPDPETHYLIATNSLDTNTDASFTDTDISYKLSLAGDGTVPFDSAQLAGVKTKLVSSEHQNLPTDREVSDATIDVLLKSPADWPDDTPTRARGTQRTRTVRSTELAAEVPFDGRVGEQLTAADHRELLESIFGGSTAKPKVSRGPLGTTPSAAKKLTGLSIGQRPRRRLEITLARGILTEADAKVTVVGLFQNVQAGGAASSINEFLSGAVVEMTQRRMFEAQAGQIFILPCPTRKIGADMVLFAGLGPFEQLDEKMHRFAAANVIRTLVGCRIYEFSTVIFGANSKLTPELALENLILGFLDGLNDADPMHRFRRIIICERDREKFEVVKQHIIGQAINGFFGETEVILDEVEFGDAGEINSRMASAKNPTAESSTYLSVRTDEERTRDAVTFDFSALTSGGKATVLQEQIDVSKEDLDALLKKVGVAPFNVKQFGKELAELVVPPGIRQLLASPEIRAQHLTIVNDAFATKIPWETIRFDDVIPSLAGGMSRRYASGGLSVAKWLEQRKADKTLNVLLIVNPTSNLEGADKEGEKVFAKLNGLTNVKVDVLKEDKATHDEILERFSSGKYDAIHYAGHAGFTPDSPQDSGIVAAGNVMVTGEDIGKLSTLPTLVFFNACQSARVRGRQEDAPTRMAKTISFAEAFLVNGIPQLIGTYWPVGDDAAEAFAGSFYSELANGSSVGRALLAGRKAVEKAKSSDWADYIHYGDPNFSLKLPQK